VGCLPDSLKPDSPKLGFSVRVRVRVGGLANRVSAKRDWTDCGSLWRELSSVVIVVVAVSSVVVASAAVRRIGAVAAAVARATVVVVRTAAALIAGSRAAIDHSQCDDHHQDPDDNSSDWQPVWGVAQWVGTSGVWHSRAACHHCIETSSTLST